MFFMPKLCLGACAAAAALTCALSLWTVPADVLLTWRMHLAREDAPATHGPHFDGVCPMLYPANHSLVNTGRKALVLYTMTSVTDIYDRQVEIDNFLFFRAHAMMPPNTPTALFSSVDYIIMTSDLSRKANATATADTIVQCSESENVRVLEGPNAPCDLCVQARVINALGGAGAVAQEYEYVVLINSGTRGPFFTESPAEPRGPPPLTWLDHFALSGEKVYTGTIMTGVVAMMGHRPFMTSFAFGFPGSLTMALHPVLSAGCSDARLPRHWAQLATTYDADLHTVGDNTTQVLENLKRVRAHPQALQSTPKGHRDAAAKKIDEKVAAGARIHYDIAVAAIAPLLKGTRRGPAPWTDRKMKCVYRAEVQIMNTALKTKLPPEMGDTSTAHPSWLRRPKLTAEQRSQLSPVLAGYLHEGHYFAHSMHHRQTVVNMGHATIFHDMGRTKECSPCSDLFPKHGGAAWRAKTMRTPCSAQVQTASLAQQPRRLLPFINVGAVLRCPSRRPVTLFRRNVTSAVASRP